MSSREPETATPLLPGENEFPPVNTVAVAGLIFGLMAAGLYSLLFYWVQALPNSADQLMELPTNTPAVLKLVAVGGSGALLNVVALMLCVAGLLIPHRSRGLALTGTIVFGAMFLGIACVVLLGTLAP